MASFESRRFAEGVVAEDLRVVGVDDLSRGIDQAAGTAVAVVEEERDTVGRVVLSDDVVAKGVGRDRVGATFFLCLFQDLRETGGILLVVEIGDVGWRIIEDAIAVAVEGL